MSEWSFNKLENFFTLKRGYDLPKQNRVLGNIPVISSSGQNDFHIEAKINESGVITGRYGTIGSVYFSEIPFWPLNTTLYVNDFKGNDKKFIYYFLQTLDWEKFSDKSAVPGVNRNDVHQEMVSFPSSQEQQAIASVLSSLDDKIDLLQRQNQTLEQMVATLFRKWFIEEAKEDWEEVTIGDLCNIVTKGTTPKSFTTLGVNFIKAESLSGNGAFIKNKFSYISEEVHFNSLKRSVLKKGDLLFSIAGTIGRVAIVTKDILPANTNQALAILRPREINYSNFIYCILKSSLFQDMIDSKVVHAVQPNLSLGEISNSSLRLPKKLVLNQFVDLIEPFFIKIRFNIQQLETLQSLRDTLLPKLISGEVRLKGFETVS